MEWSGRGIRVNVSLVSMTSRDLLIWQSISPGYIRTALTAALLDAQPEFEEIWHRKKLLGRLATPDEIRGESLQQKSTS